MNHYDVSFYVNGRRFEVQIVAASHAHAQEVIKAQYPRATLIIARQLALGRR